VRWLIDQGANVNVAGMVNGFTPLFAACENNDLDVAKLLVEAGANIETRSRDGRTPLQHALHHNRTYVADYLHQVAQQRAAQAGAPPPGA
jgi:ankyrin repeat protein